MQPFVQITRPQVEFAFRHFEHPKPSSLLLMQHFTLSVFWYLKGLVAYTECNDDEERCIAHVLSEEVLNDRGIDTFGLDRQQYAIWQKTCTGFRCMSNIGKIRFPV